MRADELRGGRLGAGLDAAITGRLPFLAAFMILVFSFFALRLFHLQLVEGEQLGRLSARNYVRTERLEAPRGDIVDREGRLLATTRPAFGIQVIPNDLREREKTLAALGLLLGKDAGALAQQIGQPRGRNRFAPLPIAGDVSYDELARVESHRYALPGVATDIQPRRHYVEGDLAAHVLGYIGEIQGRQLEQRAFADYRSGAVIGQSGVEALSERELRGRHGGRNLIVDVAGRIVEERDAEIPVSGDKVTLSIDLDLQKAAEEVFLPEVLGEPGKLGTVVVMDVRTGDILALVSKPSFDPNAFPGGIDSETWRGLTQDEWQPIQNRAISGQYPPGSIYKAIVAAAGLQEGLVDPAATTFCPGHFTLGSRTYRCWKREGHGAMNLRAAIKNSCDVYFYQLGLKLGVDRLAKIARGFMLGQTTGIPLAQERPGLVPTSEWKKKRFGEVWMGGETVSAAIGQGFNLMTPLQSAVAFAAFANGGKLMRPRLVLSSEDPDAVVTPGPEPEVVGTVPVEPVHLKRVLEALEAVVEEDGGTARRARVPGHRVAGKTGTAQVVRLQVTEDLEKSEIPLRFRDHAWFVAIAPLPEPEIVVSVLIEHGGGGGANAAPVAQKVLARYFEKQDNVYGPLPVGVERPAPSVVEADPGLPIIDGTPAAGGGETPEAAGDETPEPAGDEASAPPAGGETPEAAGDEAMAPAGGEVREAAGDEAPEPAGDDVAGD